MAMKAEEKVAGADQAAGGNAQDGPTGGQRHASCCPEEDQRGGHTHKQPDHRLDHLGDGGGQHVALALKEAPEGGDHADQQHTGSQKTDGGPGIRLILESGKGTAEEGHQQASHKAQTQKQVAGSGVDPPDLVVMLQGVGLGNHSAHGYGKPRGGDHQQDIINFVGGVKVAEALLADDGVQGDLIHSPQDLYNGGGHGKQGRTLQKILAVRFPMFSHY